MSLIEEALRKQREENEKSRTTPALPPPLPAPAHTPDTGEAQMPDAPPAHRSWALLAALVVGGVIIIVLVIWLLVFGLNLWQKAPEATPVKPVPQTPAVTPKSVPPAPMPTNEPPKVVPPAPSPMPPGPIAPPPPVSVTTTQVASTSLPVMATSGTSAPPAPQAAGLAVPTAIPPKLEMPVVWPKITVSGIIGSSKNGRSAAILNGQMVSPGDGIEGATIETIDKQKVKLRFGGESKWLTVGGSTE